MNLNLNIKEVQRIYESMKWINEKGSITDPDFISAFEKISFLNEQTIKDKKYSDLSAEAMEFIERRTNAGYKNTYHSIMSVLRCLRIPNLLIE